MFIIPIITAEDGSIYASEPAPADAICPVTTPNGVEVYMPGDEDTIAARLAEQEQPTNEE